MDHERSRGCTLLGGMFRVTLVWSVFHVYGLRPAQGLSLSGLSSSPYTLVKQSLTWVEALTYCRAQYTDLATIESDSDLVAVTAAALLNEVWIGLYLCSPGLWRWSSGNTLGTYLKWNSGMPNMTSYSCSRISFTKWSDETCDLRHYFVCYKATNITAPDIPATCQWPLVAPTVISPANGSTPISNNQYTGGFNGSNNGANQQNNAANQQNTGVNPPTPGPNPPTPGVNPPTPGPNQPTPGVNQPTSGVNPPTSGVNPPTSGVNQPTSGPNQPTDDVSGPPTGLPTQKTSADLFQSSFSLSVNSVKVMPAVPDPPTSAGQTTSAVTTISSVSTDSGNSTSQSRVSEDQNSGVTSASSGSITTSEEPSSQSSGDITGSATSTPAPQVWTSQKIGAASGLLHVVQTPLSWSKSRLYCRSNFTDLAAVLSLQEQNNMAALLSPYTPSTGFWIGLRNNRFRSQWYWSGRQKWGTFSYWGAGEPDNPFSKSCGMISGDPTHNFTWSSQCCGQDLPFVCYGGL